MTVIIASASSRRTSFAIRSPPNPDPPSGPDQSPGSPIPLLILGSKRCRADSALPSSADNDHSRYDLKGDVQCSIAGRLCRRHALSCLMGAAEEATVLAFMTAWGDGTQAEPDVETILALFTDDAVWQLWVPGGPTLHGRDEIKADIDRQLRFATHMRCGPTSIASSDGQVFTERVDRFVSKGLAIDHHLVAVFDISTDGRICAWREYFDPEEVNRQIRAASAARREERSN